MLFAAFLMAAPTFLMGQNLVFSKIPFSSQLFQRNVATNQADVSIVGKCSFSSQYISLELRLSDELGAVLQTIKKPLTFVAGEAAFDFSTKITAARNNHSIEIWGQKTANGPYFFEKKVEKLLAGDIFIINGQSNAIALASPFLDDVDEYTRSWTGQYGWGKLNFSFPGQWGARLANRIADDLGIPVAIFNGAIGASKIADLLPMPNDPMANYSQLLTRMEQAGTGKKARAAFFFQGEADGWETGILDYKNRFLTLKNAWKADFGIEHAWLFQMRYQSCTAEKPLVLEAQRQLGAENADIDIMSTTNADHDSCHFEYQNGYKLLGDRLFNVVANRFYGKTTADSEAPDVSKIYFENPTTLVVEVSGTQNMSVIGYPWLDWRTEGAAFGISGGSVSGNKIRLTVNHASTAITGLSYLGHPGNAPHWIVNPAGVGLLTFYNKPISIVPVSQPDIFFSSAAFPSSIDAGQSATYSFSIKNGGTANGSGQAVIGAWLSNDNILSANDLSLATTAINLPVAGATGIGSMLLTIPAGTATGNFFIILKCDPANQLVESNEANNEFSKNINVIGTVQPPVQNGVDLELTASTSLPKPAAWATSPVLFSLKNNGNAPATGIIVGFNLDGKVVYEGGNEATPSQGTFNYISGFWQVGSLGAGQTATIDLRLFMLDTLPKRIFGQVAAQIEADSDSQPGNGSPATGPAQDDEFWIKFNETGSSGSSGGNGNPPVPIGEYCKAVSDFPWEDWIAGVEIGSTLSKISGKTAYSDFTATPVSMQKGVAQPVILTTGFSYLGHPENWRIWLDLDGNKVFSQTEILFEGSVDAPPHGTFEKKLTGSLTIPATATDGAFRMRVGMSRNAMPGPCDTLDFGEFEDFLINITQNLTDPGDNDPSRGTDFEHAAQNWFAISPNPAGDFAVISMEKLLEKPAQIRVTDFFGKTIFLEKTPRVAQSVKLLDCRDWQNGLYFVHLETPGFRPLTRKLVVARTF